MEFACPDEAFLTLCPSERPLRRSLLREECMAERVISVSGAPYDGHSREAALESAATLGFTHFEPAFIVGYTEPFDETAFTPSEMTSWRSALRSSGLLCHAMSSHIDLGLEDSVEVFTGRMAFAAAIGAKVPSQRRNHTEKSGSL
jgi:hypothetical protein